MMEYIRAFICGGLICALSQILIDRTKLTPAKMLTSYVTAGVILTAAGIYGPIVKWGGCGATLPLFGFGYTMAEGTKTAVSQYGLTGALSGGLAAASAGIGCAVLFSLIGALIFKSHSRS